MTFEDRKFCQIQTLLFRWDCSRSYIHHLLSRGKLKAWHPDGKGNQKGMKIDVASILEIEQNGYLE